ncbi:unnamed protein product [Amoebophrya sp. A120]|nr:unnamed protein product [Amoebophrya sp. A120]|eukprot:GSA120T00019598001.1
MIQYPFLATLCLPRESEAEIAKLLIKTTEAVGIGKNWEKPDRKLVEQARATLENQLTMAPRGKLEVLQTLTRDVLDEKLVPQLLLTILLPVPKLRPRPLADGGTGSRREASKRDEGLRRVRRSSSRSARGRSNAKSPASPSRDAAEPHGRSSSRNGSSPSRSPSRGRKKCCTRRRSRLGETSCTLS